MGKKCKHTNIIITTKESYDIPQGWHELQEQEDIDLAEYFTGNSESTTFCGDCGKYLDE